MDVSVSWSAVEFSTPARRGASGLARDFVRKTLDEWGYRGAHDDVVLVASELVANALRHTDSAPVVRLAGGAHGLRIEVADGSGALPRVRTSGVQGGWGLALVQKLAARWGAYPDRGGKVVWCEMTVGARLPGLA